MHQSQVGAASALCELTTECHQDHKPPMSTALILCALLSQESYIIRCLRNDRRSGLGCAAYTPQRVRQSDFGNHRCFSASSYTTELLWLPEQMSLDEALALAKDSRVLGKAQKGQSKTLALRFKDTTAMAAFAGEKKLDDVSALGRFKIIGFPVPQSRMGSHCICSPPTKTRDTRLYPLWTSVDRGLGPTLYWGRRWNQ